jgi:hypothetical protein
VIDVQKNWDNFRREPTSFSESSGVLVFIRGTRQYLKSMTMSRYVRTCVFTDVMTVTLLVVALLLIVGPLCLLVLRLNRG